jgi:phosphatidylinositol 3-kinase
MGAATFGVEKNCYDTFVKSMAGYTIMTCAKQSRAQLPDAAAPMITMSMRGGALAVCPIPRYLLAIGDRHLNNLMIRTTGHLFHIDFGFILGLDPKPMPPPMRVTTEMVTALGGYDGEHYARFKTYCCEAFNTLRKHSALIINMHVLMKDAHIPDFEKAGERGIMTIAERFRMDMSDEEAVQYIQQLIMDSVTALMPKLMETIHAAATAAR